MSLETFRLWIAPVGFLANILAQIVIARYFPRAGLLKSVMAGFAVGYGFLGLLEIVHSPSLLNWERDEWALFAADSLIYGALGYNYFHFINMGETARRIRILRELYESEDGLTESEILARYNAGHMVNLRLKRLLNNKQILLKEGRYCIGNPTVLTMSRCIVLMKKFLLGKTSEFE